MGSQIVGILGIRNNCSAVDLIFTSRITFRFETTRLMHKQKVTKLGSLKLHLPYYSKLTLHEINANR